MVVMRKHVDFEVMGWGEVSPGPVDVGYALRPVGFRADGLRPGLMRPEVGAGGVALSQSAGAAFPDRGAVGLSVALSAGEDGAFVERDLGAGAGVVHTRLMLNPGTAPGGEVSVCVGLDEVGGETFRVVLDADARRVEARVGGEVIGAGLAGALAWHCVELMLDAAGGVAELWVNGVSVGTAAGAFVGLVTRRVRLGGLFKDAGVTGEVYLDEWVTDGGYIGPVVVEPGGEYGDDPARWLVVFNTGDADAVVWAEAYRAARGIPYANLAGLALSGDEVVDTAGYLSLRDAVGSYLTRNGLDGKVIGLLLGYGVPGYVDFAGFGVLDAIPGLVHDLGTVPKLNPLAGVPGVVEPVRPSLASLQGLKLTARVDGADVVSAISMIDRATVLIDGGLGDGLSGTVWLDPYAGPGPVNDPHIEAMVAWAGSVDRQLTRLPLELSAEVDPQAEVRFDTIFDDGFFWGWSDALPAGGFFGVDAGARVFCFQLYPDGATCATLRAGVPVGWVDGALSAGYAAGAGTSRAYSADAIPSVGAFFGGLRRGWSLGEAWFVANPILGEGLFLVGDPLLKAAMPRGGWDVFGPVDRLEGLDLGLPSVALREEEGSVVLGAGLKPGAGEVGSYLIRHVDSAGRSEAGVKVLVTGEVGGLAVGVAARAVWPVGEGWAVRVEGGVARAVLVWERALREAGVGLVELIGEVDGGSAQVLQGWVPDGFEWFVEGEVALPAVSLRLRWRVTGIEGSVYETGWSLLVRPAGGSGVVKIEEVGL